MTHKSTVHGGVTHSTVTYPAGRTAWAGSSSETSSESQSPSSESESSESPSPAPTTESPSGEGQTESSSAPSTAGNGQETVERKSAEELEAMTMPQLRDAYGEYVELPTSLSKPQMIERILEAME